MTADHDAILDLAQRALREPPAEIPARAVAAMVARTLDSRDRLLAAAGEHGSPLYVFDERALREKAARFRRVMGQAAPSTRVYYALKSNNFPLVAGTFLDCGLGLDVSSGLELATALDLGAEEIIFSGPGKTEAELALAAGHAGRVTVLIDSFAELERLDEAAAREGAVVRAGVRLTSAPGGMWRKFGIPLSRLEEFLKAADRCGHVDLKGLQFHTSWNLRPRAQVAFIASLGEALSALAPGGTGKLEFIDVGGGYWPEEGEWLQEAGTTGGALCRLLTPASADTGRRYHVPAVPIERFASQLGEAIQRHLLPVADFTVCFEPGRWLCHDGMYILMTVVDRKEADLVITDAGTSAVGWERFETDFFPVINLTRPALSERRCDVHGCLCTPHDIWGYSVWGEDVRPGDLLVVPSQGAYTYSLRQQFIKPLPKAVMI